jgi:hypothetical protein
MDLPDGVFDVLCAPNGEHRRQKRRRYRDRILPSIKVFAGKSPVQDSHTFIEIGRIDFGLAESRGWIGRHSRHFFRPRKFICVPLITRYIANSAPHSAQLCTIEQ